ncbi:MAG: hypothetical protein M3291_03175, partial [Actinomycetota bacterium]|nr:hypothetical protein [Actinomycetota bacterium]
VAAPMTVIASPAYAATGVSKSGDQLIVTAASGRANDLFVRRSPNGQFILVRDRGDTLTPGPGCQAVGTEVQCSRSGINRIVVNAGDRNDRIAVNNLPNTLLNGEGGNDILSAGFAEGRNILNGGADDDSLFAGSFGDSLRGGAGNDFLVGSQFTDFLRGGTGNDDLRGGEGNDELRGDAGNDRLDGGAGFDDLCIGETEINCEADV